MVPGSSGADAAEHGADLPPIERLCSLPTFQGTFQSGDFVAALSEEPLARARGVPGPLNAQPFLDTFRRAIGELQNIRGGVTEECTSLNSAVQVAQSVYSKKLRQLTHNFDVTQAAFNALEGRITDVGRTAIRIGEQLETLDRQRKRAGETHDLIEYYYMFARGDTNRLDELRKNGGRDGRLKAAMITRRLAIISREVDVPGASETREKIDRYCEQFERDMLKLFDKYYRRSDPKMMSHIAHVLQSFNGGVSCIQIYVNQHDFFISKDSVIEVERISASPVWETITDPDAPPPRTEPSLEGLFTEVRRTVELEAQIIAAVFPNPLLVMQTFLQRVFAQSVQGFVEGIMRRAQEADKEAAAATSAPSGTARPDEASGLAFLRMLHVTRTCTQLLVNDLKRIDFRSAGITGATNAHTPNPRGPRGVLGFTGEHPDADAAARALGTPGYSTAQLAAAGGSVLGAMLDQSVEELFFPYLETVRYIDRECRSLSALYATALQRFIAWHRAAIKASRANANIFSRVREQFTGGGVPSFGSSVAYASLADSGGLSSSAAPVSSLQKLLERARGGSAAHPDTPELEEHAASGNVSEDGAGTTAEHGALSLTLGECLLRWHAEALGRSVDLTVTSEVPKNTFTLLRVLTDAYLKSYVEAALETATVQMFAYEARSAALPDLHVLHTVRHVEQLLALWQHYVQTAVLPLAAPSVTIRRETVIYNNHNMLRVEGRCEALLQKLADNVLAFLAAQLATQKKNDYLPRNDDDMTLARLNTEPCLAIVEALERLTTEVRQTLSERNRDLFFTEVGIGFHALLLEHLKKYTVSATGGLMLTKDLAMYQDAASHFGVPVVNDRFEMLRQLGNLFIVQPAVLKSYMREGHLAKIDEPLLRPYLLRRQDYSREVRDLPDRPSGEDGGATPTSSSSFFASLSSPWASDKRHGPAQQDATFLTDLPDQPGWSASLARQSAPQRAVNPALAGLESHDPHTSHFGMGSPSQGSPARHDDTRGSTEN